GVARMRGTATIAGSTATMDELYRAAVDQLGSSDAALAAATQMTATTPARALGLDHVGALHPGCDANLVVLDHDLQVGRVMVRGAWQDMG
ncbi:MAG: amidohydrolase family protein, partial [Mycobacterium sp.]